MKMYRVKKPSAPGSAGPQTLEGELTPSEQPPVPPQPNHREADPPPKVSHPIYRKLWGK